jgi:hypothetical protein
MKTSEEMDDAAIELVRKTAMAQREADLRVRAEIPMRPSVAQFATLMERRLDEHDHKGGWKSAPTWRLFAEASRHLVALERVVNRHGVVQPGHIEDVRREAADVANFLMMVVDVATRGAIDGPT